MIAYSVGPAGCKQAGIAGNRHHKVAPARRVHVRIRILI